MTGLSLRDAVTGEELSLDATGLLIAIGHDPRNELVLGQVNVDDDGYVLVDHPTTHTNFPGVYACGDLVDQGDRQAITAAGNGCAAAGGAEHFLAATGLATYGEEAAVLDGVAATQEWAGERRGRFSGRTGRFAAVANRSSPLSAI